MKLFNKNKNIGFERNTISKVIVLLILSNSTVYAADLTLSDMKKLLDEQQHQISEQMKLINELQKNQKETKNIQLVSEQKAQEELEKKQNALKMTRPGSVSFSPADNTVLTLFGGADMGMFYQNKSGGPGLSYHPNNSSRLSYMGNAEGSPNLGVRGVYQMSPGWTVGMEASGGVTYSDTSTTKYNPFNKAFNIQFGTPYGKFIIGEQLDPAWLASVRSDPRDAKQTYDALAAAWSFGQGTSTPQTSFYPTGAFGYKAQVGALNIGLLYKPSVATSYVPLEDNHEVGQQGSIGLVYDDHNWLLSGAYMEKYGTTTSINDMDVRNWTLGVGKHFGDVLLQTGVSSVYLPHGVTGAPLGVSSTPWPNISNKQHIFMSYTGLKWQWDDMNVLDFTYSYSYDKLNTDNNAKMFVLGNDYKVNKYLTFYVSGAVIVAGDDANPLTAGTTPLNVAKPGTTTLSSMMGVRVSF